MAVDVTIKSKGLFKRKLTIKDIIDSSMRYGIMDDDFCLEEGAIGENTVIFNKENICRGYEITLKKGEINLRMPLPTSTSDINFFYEYIKKLCLKMNTKTFIRDEETISFDDIDNCIQLDIEASINALRIMEKNIDSKESENIYIFGAVNPVAIGKKELAYIAKDTTKLGILMNSLQTKDVYYATPKVYQSENNSYFGVYVLTEEVPTVLPIEPKLLMPNTDIKIDDWNIGFVVEGKVEGFIQYSDFLNATKKKEEYDSEHFIITLNSKNIKDLVNKYKVDL